MAVAIQQIASEKEDAQAGAPVYKIVSYPADYTLDVLYQKWKNNEIIIPSSQRFWIWRHAQASKLIDSFLLGLPVPSIFLYKEPLEEKLLVIDGHQRLLTIWSFFDGALPDGTDFYLKNVSPQWEGKHYRDLEEPEQRRLRDSVLRAVIVEQLDPRDNSSVYYIFERLNTGGTSLTPQEVRNSSYHGPFNDLLINLNTYPTWRAIVGSEVRDRRMRDVELIVRFLALYEGYESYTKTMKEFLNRFMARHQREVIREPYETVFIQTVTRVFQSLGPKPFHIKRGINVAVFDSVMVAYAKSTGDPHDLRDRFAKLLANSSYREATSSGTTDVDTVKRRIALAQQVLFG